MSSFCAKGGGGSESSNNNKYPSPFGTPLTNPPSSRRKIQPKPKPSTKNGNRHSVPNTKAARPACPPRPSRSSAAFKLQIHPDLPSFVSILRTPACLQNNTLLKTHSSRCACNFKGCEITLDVGFCCFMLNAVYHVVQLPEAEGGGVLEFERELMKACGGYRPPADMKELTRGGEFRFAYKSSQCLLKLSEEVLEEGSPYNGNIVILKKGPEREQERGECGGVGVGGGGVGGVGGVGLQMLEEREAKYISWVNLRKLRNWFFKSVSTRASKVNEDFLEVLKAGLIYAEGGGDGGAGVDVDADVDHLIRNVEGLELRDEGEGAKFDNVIMPENVQIGHHLSSYLDRSYEFSSEELEFEALLIYLPTLKNGKTKDCWDVPGGKREIGETTFTAGIRETEEEAGIRLTGGIEGLRKRGIARNGEVFWEVYL
ncbi:hypothetical protein TrST_g12294 [Triparma strigata]|uniref:Nudix hydrolase domain-containing protein n=1 Tax=Triparma strigata TaxID=1606541 RepID=A0A9W7B503_9STRA|nr:hypothetical protein TrST_g12294 [Triparma strigata]